MIRFKRTFVFGLGLVVAMSLGQGCPKTSTTGTQNNDTSSGNNLGNNSTTPYTAYGRAKAVVPEALTPDLAEFPEDSPASAADRGIRGHHGRGPGDHCCVLGNGVILESQFLLDRGLAKVARQLNADVLAAGGTDPHLTGTFEARRKEVAYKADFSAFDIDADGTADGSGQPATAPIAVRLWVDPNGDGTFVRYLCAVLTIPPTPADPAAKTPANPGAGQLYIQPGILADEADTGFHLFIHWDHTDAANIFNDAFLSGSLGNGMVVANAHVRIDLNTLADQSVQKTLKSTAAFSGNDLGVSEFDYAARTATGIGFALVNAKVTGTGLNGEFNACLSLRNCSPSATGCSTIDSTGLDFLAAPAGTETNFPADFPEQPTF